MFTESEHQVLNEACCQAAMQWGDEGSKDFVALARELNTAAICAMRDIRKREADVKS